MAKKRINREKNVETGVVTFTNIADGQTVECDVKQIFPQYAELSDVQRQAVMHAINAKVGDSAADPNADAVEAMKSTWANLVNGEWNTRSAGEGGTRITQLAKALQRVTGKDMDAVVARLSEMDDEQKKDLRKHPQVAAAIDEIKLEEQREKAKKAKAAAKDADQLDF